jgi:CubicO group peptidase (beta-lactamase class C family)
MDRMRLLPGFFAWLGLVAQAGAAPLPPTHIAPLTPEHVAMADRYSQTHNGLALVIVQGGRTLCDDHSRLPEGEPFRIYSGTKNFVALTCLIAAQTGLLSLDEPASLTLTEWRHDRRRSITIRQLLNQTSGLDPSAGMIGDSRDQMGAAVQARLRAAPGDEFHYGPANYQALGEILRRKLARTGTSVQDYMERVIFDPLDVDVSAWARDDAGQPLMHAGIQLTTENWLKFGLFILHRGAVGGRQLVEPRLFAQLFTGTDANPAYGLSFWLNRAEDGGQPMRDLQPAMDGEQLDAGGPRDIAAAEGSDKQRLYVIPSRDLVIVRFAAGGRFSDQDFLSRLLTGRARPDARSH